ncbi:hypothetical protein H5410_001098 [Solanum commersonii]|uniref:Uncharacterized protein n=1 Tax=Solanum commersonii TaxID=4109 RepID=A0A9J6AXQ1_SOLCO|nr:hypothetical protein H5410_001098 [Solanum commersonii]
MASKKKLSNPTRDIKVRGFPQHLRRERDRLTAAKKSLGQLSWPIPSLSKARYTVWVLQNQRNEKIACYASPREKAMQLRSGLKVKEYEVVEK